QKFRIVSQKRLVHVLGSKDQPVMSCAKCHRTPKMALIQSAVSCRTLEFHPQWIDATPSPASADCNRPREAHIDQHERLRTKRHKNHKNFCGFCAFLWLILLSP